MFANKLLSSFVFLNRATFVYNNKWYVVIMNTYCNKNQWVRLFLEDSWSKYFLSAIFHSGHGSHYDIWILVLVLKIAGVFITHTVFFLVSLPGKQYNYGKYCLPVHNISQMRDQCLDFYHVMVMFCLKYFRIHWVLCVQSWVCVNINTIRFSLNLIVLQEYCSLFKNIKSEKNYNFTILKIIQKYFYWNI